MKKLLALGVLASLTLSAFGQGQVVFNNRVTTTTAGVNDAVIDAKVYVDAVGGTLCSGSGYRAALLGGAVGSTPASASSVGTLTLLASPTTAATWVEFRTGAPAGYINIGTDVARVTALPYGTTGVFQMVAWSGNYTTFAAAYAAAQSDLSVKVGWSALLTRPTSQNATDLNPPNLQGLASFAITTVPEPSTMALAGLGAAALLIFRRRK